MSEFIVLRDQNFWRRMSNTGQRGSFSQNLNRGFVSLDPAGGVMPEPIIDLADLTSTQMKDTHRDPAVMGIARPMPIRLIDPVATQTQAQPWGVSQVGADITPFDGTGVKVAVLDTGIDPDHPAFAGVKLQMKNFTGGPDTEPDGNGHGTHCAGTIFGRDVEGQRIGVARGVDEALIGKVLADEGGGGSEMLFNGMKWAHEQGAKVISMSLGFDFPGMVENLIADGWPPKLAASAALEAYRGNLRVFDAILSMFRALGQFDGGTIVVAASGNESERQIDPSFEVSASLPSAAEGVISVGALGQTAQGLTVADFSNTNPILSAPGVDIVSAATGGGLATLSGTSMACPHVAGLAALWWQALSSATVPLTAEAVTARLRTHADEDAFAPGVDIADRGEGLAMAPQALFS